MTRPAGLELLDEMIGRVRAARSAFEPTTAVARRVWDSRRGDLGYRQFAPFALTGARCVQLHGRSLPGFPLPPGLVAVIVAGGVMTPAELDVVDLGDREMLAATGFVALAYQRLLEEDSASRPVS